jgi:hypothetical protein
MMTDVKQMIEKHRNFVKKVVWMNHRKSVGILKEHNMSYLINSSSNC